MPNNSAMNIESDNPLLLLPYNNRNIMIGKEEIEGGITTHTVGAKNHRTLNRKTDIFYPLNAPKRSLAFERGPLLCLCHALDTSYPP
jgi:hypothetical protein